MEITISKDTILLDELSIQFTQTSKNKLRKMLTEGRISVNDKIEHKAKRELTKGDIIKILDKTTSKEITPPPQHKVKNLEKEGKFNENAYENIDRKKEFFHLGPNNNWENILENKIKNEIEEKLSSEMKELGYI